MGKGKPKGSVHAVKSTQQQMVLAKKLTAKQVAKSVQDFRPDDSDDDELKFITDARGESDDDDEEEVFDLEGEEDSENEDDDDDDQSGDDSGEDEDNSDAGSDDEDDDEDGEGNSTLKNLVDGLDPRLRQKVMMGGKKGGRAADDDSDEESEDEKEEGWGKKKAYWSGDTADLEIGQDVQDAEDEEEAAEELQREKLGRMQESDYFEDFGEGQEIDEDFETEKPTGGKKNKKGKQKGKDKLMEELEYLALGEDAKDSSMQIEHLAKDISKLTEDQKLAYVKAQSPELLGLIADLKSRVSELRDKVAPLRAFVLKMVASSSSEVQDDIVDYLEVKQQLLLSYCINVTFYLYMKAQGQSVKAHPVMKQLLELRYAMEKMRSLDGKLKHQIDRLMKLSTRTSDTPGSSSLRPNPLALLSKGGDDEDSEEEESSGKPQAGEFYRAPKMAAAPYKETESEANKREDRLNRKKKKLNSSEIMETLREEFSTAPESSSSSGISKVSVDQRRLQDEANERKDFEEERFVRLTMSRNEKKDIKRRTADASRLDNFNDIGDIGEFEELAELSKSITKGKKGVSSEVFAEEEPKKKGKASMDSGDTAKALQRAVNAFSGAASKGKPVKESDDYLAEMYDAKAPKANKSKPSSADMDDSDDEPQGVDYDEEEEEFDNKKDRKRRRAYPMEGEDDMEEGDGLLEEFAKKKRDFAAKKKEHYAPEARYGGLVETVPDSGKRGATYEIMKNKGLTPHRKKENRNPRVKKRLAYEKAIVRRKGQVREVTAGAAGTYDGELTGIKANIARSRKISN